MRLIYLVVLSLLFCLPARADTQMGDVCMMVEDYACALKEYQSSSSDAGSMYGLGLLYHRGYGVAQNYELAYDWFLKGGQAGSMDATYELGKMYENAQHVLEDLNQSIKLYQLASDRGHAPSMVALGEIYSYYGTDEERPQAFPLFQKAADAGDADGNYHIYLAHFLGAHGLEKNVQAGIPYLIEAADGGNDEAAVILANYYISGEYVEKDEDLAFEYVEYAAYGGHPEAMRATFISYKEGIGIEADIIMAGVWLTLAHQADPEANAQDYANMTAALSSDQLDEIKRMVDEKDY